ncbi:unnamed protein product [Calicophoron daubneyi]|uniref:Protein MIX23 n=1 Tax=Calicophoron daubneyi TaxID=300641 RepID=A0AAV2TAP9_CALDB
MEGNDAPPDSSLPCDDFLQFTKLLAVWRKEDDRVRHQLNTLLPTASFQAKLDFKKTCDTFLQQMLANHDKRNRSIKYCLAKAAGRLDELKHAEDNAANEDRHRLVRSVRKQQLLVCPNRIALHHRS